MSKRLTVPEGMEKYGKMFREIFKIDLKGFVCKDLMCFNMWSFDIITFDKWMIERKGYEIEQHGSLCDFILKEYGQRATDFIKEIL